VGNLLAQQRKDDTWKQTVEASINRVQTAGNALEEKVRQMDEEVHMIWQGQKAKIEELEKSNRGKDKEITQLQQDSLSQEKVNKE
jgi:hypothetical protein